MEAQTAVAELNSPSISPPNTSLRRNRLQKAADKKRKIKEEVPPINEGTSTACPIDADEAEENNAAYAEDSDPIPLTRAKRVPAKKRILWLHSEVVESDCSESKSQLSADESEPVDGISLCSDSEHSSDDDSYESDFVVSDNSCSESDWSDSNGSHSNWTVEM